jgi:uncharacterized FAD-dependent dehydrogenase
MMLLTFVVLMNKRIEIRLLPKEVLEPVNIRVATLRKLKWQDTDNVHVQIVRKSIDARGRQPVYRVLVEAFKDETPAAEPIFMDSLKDVSSSKHDCIIIGAGPAGYFAALELIEQGIKPIILERGKNVRERRRDLKAIQQFGEVNPHSNYCFGEGGAGTYSDGKLYTRSQKRGNIYKALKLLVEHGANTDILIDAHPHIGSNKLPKVVENIRETILKYGGEIHFNSYVTNFIIQNNRIEGVSLETGKEFRSNTVILATGHSARDIYYKLNEKGVTIESKPFALGVRIEHPQSLIDQIQYNQKQREENLPASSYKLVCQIRNRGVFSFCMCPGGLVVPAATAPGEIVVNGMSMSRRDSPFANSGTVVAIEKEDLLPFASHGVFAGLELQRSVEKAMFDFGDGTQKAPSQRMTDFIHSKRSKSLPDTSYIPGLLSAPVHDLLPSSISGRLRDAVQIFGKKMKGYYTSEANIIGVESRTSSPIKIPRNKETYMHEDVAGLFPCGEGAGYAGGIISAAMDGQNVARAVRDFLDISS